MSLHHQTSCAGEIPTYQARHGEDPLTPAFCLLWPRRTHGLHLETAAGQGCNLLCKTQRFEGCSSVMWITRGISKSGEDESSVKRCLARGGSVHPVFGWRGEGRGQCQRAAWLRRPSGTRGYEMHPSSTRPGAVPTQGCSPQPRSLRDLRGFPGLPPGTASPAPGHPKSHPLEPQALAANQSHRSS